MAEGLARYVRKACTQLVKEGAAREVHKELLENLKAGQIHAEWKRDKTALISQLVLTAEALGRNSAAARASTRSSLKISCSR